MEYFERIIKHYIILALKRAGVNVDSDTHAELTTACESLEDGIRRIVREELDKEVE